jgi:hypothetical protein
MQYHTTYTIYHYVLNLEENVHNIFMMNTVIVYRVLHAGGFVKRMNQSDAHITSLGGGIFAFSVQLRY